MAKTGRPVTRPGKAAKRHREQARKWYQRQTPADKASIVAGRDKKAQREADARRHARDRAKRNAYHSAQQKAKGSRKSPGRCSACGSTSNVQYHHQGRGRWLCAKCHAKVRGYVR